MAIDLKLIDFQRALDEVGKALKELKSDKFALVGIHETSAPPVDAQMTMATLGALQNFGTENGDIPARPWLEPGVESGNKEYLEIIQEGFANGTPPEKILNQVGNSAVGYTKQFIVDLRDPPNAPSTIAKKGSDNPLIDTGAMMNSVTYTIDQKPQEGL